VSNTQKTGVLYHIADLGIILSISPMKMGWGKVLDINFERETTI
jgi:hypothetical protein